jgi:AN1-type zinc finger protein 1
MASSSTETPPAPIESFTMLPDKDLDSIGAHCHYTYCNQLDFLPFRCESCQHTYCLDHRTETAHACPNAGAWAAKRRTASAATSGGTLPQKPTLATGTQCSSPQCKTFINTGTSVGVLCQTCNRNYCLKHRLKEDHACSTLTPLGARPAAVGLSQAQKALARLKAWGKQKAEASTEKRKANSMTSRIMQVNQLKKEAKGDAKIPADKRVYLHVEAEATTTTSKLPSGSFFYSKEWSIGRMLDEAARGLQVENVNNRGGGEDTKLRVFHVEGGRLLEFSEKVGAGLQDGNTIVLLRGVGPAIPDLIGS